MPIRQQPPLIDNFVENFQESILRSPIPLADLIPWEEIDADMEEKSHKLPVIESEDDPSEFFLQEFIRDEEADIRCELLFELLGFPGKCLSSRERTWNPEEIDFSNLSSDKEEKFAEDLVEIDAHRILQSRETVDAHIEQNLLYQQKHKRRNYAMNFEGLVAESLDGMLSNLGSQTRINREARIPEIEGNNRIFDFVLYQNNEPRVVFEVTYFQTPGSKLSELSRIFDRLSTKLRNEGIEFVWITDGEGWLDTSKTLEEAYKNIIDVYNYEQMEDVLGGNIREFLLNGPTVSEGNVNLNRYKSLEDFE